jgi:DNA-binding beta-propeller fold protein YncE
MKCRHQRSLAVGAFFFALLCLFAGLHARATDLPTTVLTYLRKKDPAVQVRFDGLVTFSNGERYLPVIPQDPALNAEPQQVIATRPEKAVFPDLIEFDNHFYFIRLIQTASGRLTFPKMDAYPIQLKEGLLPQDLVLPDNLFIPVELKVILGALPYNPTYTPPKAAPAAAASAKKPFASASAGKPSASKPPAASRPSAPASLPSTGVPSVGSTPSGSENPARNLPQNGYVFDIQEQKLLAFDPLTGRKQADLTLNCAPSALQMTPDGKLLFAPCLSTNELVVIDTEANLIKNRVPVGRLPDAALYLPDSKQVLISSRASSYLSVIDAESLLPREKMDVPGNTGALAAFPGQKAVEIAVADATQPSVYIVNRQTRRVERTLPALPDMSALTVIDRSATPDARGESGQEIWVASRTQNRVLALDARTGATLARFDVARKPVALAAYEDKVYVLCAGDARVSVIDRLKKALLPPIALEEHSFPSGMTVLPAAGRAYIGSAGENTLVVLNLKAARVENTFPVTFRASLIALSPGVLPAAAVSPSLQPLPAVQEKRPVTLPTAQTVYLSPSKKTISPATSPPP